MRHCKKREYLRAHDQKAETAYAIGVRRYEIELQPRDLP